MIKREITPMEPIEGARVRGPYAWMKAPDSFQEHGLYGDAFEVAYFAELPDEFTVKGVTYLKADRFEVVSYEDGYADGFDNGIKAALQQLDGLIIDGFDLKGIRDWINHEFKELDS